MDSLRIENGLLITMAKGSDPIPDGVVVTEDGQIVYAGPAAKAPQQPADQVIDAEGGVILPGFVNAHTHLAMTLFRGAADDMPLQAWLEERIWPAEMKLTDEDVYWGSLLGVCEMLRAGVTCFNDMYHIPAAATRAAIEGGIRACPSGVLLGFLPNAKELLAEAKDFVNQLQQQAHPRIHPMLAPHAPYTCPDDLLREVVSAAQQLQVPIHIHVAETADEVRDSYQDHGQSPVQYLDSLGVFDCPVVAVHCVHIDEQDIQILAERQVGIAHCPGSNMKLASGFAPLPDLLASGAIVGLGTDGCASNNNLDLREEAFLTALIHKARTGDPTFLPAQQALTMATRESARALGLQDLIGTLQPGKRADIIVVDMSQPHMQPVHNPVSQLIYAAHADDVKITVVEGQIVMRDGQVLLVDEQEVIARAGECAHRLLG